VLLIDAANVMGARPDGWWRDRAGAAQRLVTGVRAAVAAGRLSPPVVVVLEGQARAGVAADESDGVRVVHAPGSGDDELVRLAAESGDGRPIIESGDGRAGRVVAVTADRGLRGRLQARGAEVVGPSWLLARLAP
jgi:hypothetical protein